MNLPETDLGLDEPPTWYQGRKWDAPFTDNAVETDLSNHPCTLCQEEIEPSDNAFATPYMRTHLECYVRSGMGDVQHLEGRCICFNAVETKLDSDTYETWRESAKASLQWLVDNHRGRFHP